MQVADQVLDRYWDGRLPVDVEGIAKKMGIDVWADGTLGDASGHYLRHGPNGRPLITYNLFEAPTRQRFTIAHELGHHLQGDNDAPRDTSAKMFSGDIREIGANALAASLLMPRALVEHLVFAEGITNVDNLADLFQVSSSAMNYRLMHLRII